MVGNLFQMLYTDLLTIYELVDIKNEDGSVSEERLTIPKYENIPCRISYRSSSEDDGISPDFDTNPQNITIKVFCEPHVTIIKGNYIVVNRNYKKIWGCPKKYDGYAGEPRLYPTHQEFYLNDTYIN